MTLAVKLRLHRVKEYHLVRWLGQGHFVMTTYIRSAENSCCLSNTFICDWRVGQNNYRWRLQHFTQNRYILTPRGRWFASLSETLIFAPADRNTFDIGTVHFPTSLSTRTHAHCHSHANLHARFIFYDHDSRPTSCTCIQSTGLSIILKFWN